MLIKVNTTSHESLRRKCGDCTLCCRLLPMHEGDGSRSELTMLQLGLIKSGIPSFEKPAGERCPHQRHGKGCAIYSRRPCGCQAWNCRWLVNDDTADQSRPDRSHYVIDVMPDYVTVADENGRANIPAVQIWIDPKFREAHRDPALRTYLARQGEAGIVAIIRFGTGADSFVLIPPAMTSDGRWIERAGDVVRMREPSAEGHVADMVAGLSTATTEAKFK